MEDQIRPPQGETPPQNLKGKELLKQDVKTVGNKLRSLFSRRKEDPNKNVAFVNGGQVDMTPAPISPESGSMGTDGNTINSVTPEVNGNGANGHSESTAPADNLPGLPEHQIGSANAGDTADIREPVLAGVGAGTEAALPATEESFPKTDSSEPLGINLPGSTDEESSNASDTEDPAARSRREFDESIKAATASQKEDFRRTREEARNEAQARMAGTAQPAEPNFTEMKDMAGSIKDQQEADVQTLDKSPIETPASSVNLETPVPNSTGDNLDTEQGQVEYSVGHGGYVGETGPFPGKSEGEEVISETPPVTETSSGPDMIDRLKDGGPLFQDQDKPQRWEQGQASTTPKNQSVIDAEGDVAGHLRLNEINTENDRLAQEQKDRETRDAEERARQEREDAGNGWSAIEKPQVWERGSAGAADPKAAAEVQAHLDAQDDSRTKQQEADLAMGKRWNDRDQPEASAPDAPKTQSALDAEADVEGHLRMNELNAKADRQAAERLEREQHEAEERAQRERRAAGKPWSDMDELDGLGPDAPENDSVRAARKDVEGHVRMINANNEADRQAEEAQRAEEDIRNAEDAEQRRREIRERTQAVLQRIPGIRISPQEVATRIGGLLADMAPGMAVGMGGHMIANQLGVPSMEAALGVGAAASMLTGVAHEAVNRGVALEGQKTAQRYTREADRLFGDEANIAGRTSDEQRQEWIDQRVQELNSAPDDDSPQGRRAIIRRALARRYNGAQIDDAEANSQGVEIPQQQVDRYLGELDNADPERRRQREVQARLTLGERLDTLRPRSWRRLGIRGICGAIGAYVGWNLIGTPGPATSADYVPMPEIKGEYPPLPVPPTGESFITETPWKDLPSDINPDWKDPLAWDGKIDGDIGKYLYGDKNFEIWDTDKIKELKGTPGYEQAHKAVLEAIEKLNGGDITPELNKEYKLPKNIDDIIAQYMPKK
jgi:hypothetical protein